MNINILHKINQNNKDSVRWTSCKAQLNSS